MDEKFFYIGFFCMADANDQIDLVPLTKPSHRTQVVERCCWHGTKEDQQ
ncbi:hypothetical protein ACI2S6_18650 [Ralstonia nicotianae]|nr:hypothetical protein [Ralstonia pseudosolanacearum]